MNDATAGALEGRTFRYYLREIGTSMESYSITDVQLCQRTVNNIKERYLGVVQVYRISGENHEALYYVKTLLTAISPGGITVPVWQFSGWDIYYPSSIEWPFEAADSEIVLEKFQDITFPIVTTDELNTQIKHLVLHPTEELNTRLSSALYHTRFDSVNEDPYPVVLYYLGQLMGTEYGHLRKYGLFAKTQIDTQEHGAGFVATRYVMLRKRYPGLRLKGSFCEVVYALNPQGNFVAIIAKTLDSPAEFSPMETRFENPFERNLDYKPEYSSYEERNAQALELLKPRVDLPSPEFTEIERYNPLIEDYVMEGKDEAAFDLLKLDDCQYRHYHGDEVFSERYKICEGKIQLYKKQTENGLERYLAISRKDHPDGSHIASEGVFNTTLFAITESGKYAISMVKMSVVISFSGDFPFPFDSNDNFLPEKVIGGVIYSAELQMGYRHVDNLPFYRTPQINQAFKKFIRRSSIWGVTREKQVLKEIKYVSNEKSEVCRLEAGEMYLLLKKHEYEIRRTFVVKKLRPGISLTNPYEIQVIAISPEGQTLHIESEDSPWPFTHEERITEEAQTMSREIVEKYNQPPSVPHYPTKFSFHSEYNFQFEKFVQARVVGKLDMTHDKAYKFQVPGSYSAYAGSYGLQNNQLIRDEAMALQKGYVFYYEIEEDEMVKRWLIMMRGRFRNGKYHLETIVYAISPDGHTKIVFHQNQYAPYCPDPLPYAYGPDSQLLNEWQGVEITLEDSGEFNGYSYHNFDRFSQIDLIEELLKVKLAQFQSEGQRFLTRHSSKINDRIQTLEKDVYTEAKYLELQELRAVKEKQFYILSKMDGFRMKRWIVRKVPTRSLAKNPQHFITAAEVHTNGEIVLVHAEDGDNDDEDNFPTAFESDRIILPYSDPNSAVTLRIKSSFTQHKPQYSSFTSSILLNEQIETFAIAHFFSGNSIKLMYMDELPALELTEVRDRELMEGKVALIEKDDRRWVVLARNFGLENEKFEFEVHALDIYGFLHIVSKQNGIVMKSLKDLLWPFRASTATEELLDEWVDKIVEVENSPELSQYEHSFDYPFHSNVEINAAIEQQVRIARRNHMFGESGSLSLKQDLQFSSGYENIEIQKFLESLQDDGDLLLEFKRVNGVIQRSIKLIQHIRSENDQFFFKQIQQFFISPSGNTLVVVRRKTIIFFEHGQIEWPFTEDESLLPQWSSNLVEWSKSAELNAYTYIDVGGISHPFSPVPEINSIIENIIRSNSLLTTLYAIDLKVFLYTKVQEMLEITPQERHAEIDLEMGRIIRGELKLEKTFRRDSCTRHLLIVRRFDYAAMTEDTRSIHFNINKEGHVVKVFDKEGTYTYMHHRAFDNDDVYIPDWLGYDNTDTNLNSEAYTLEFGSQYPAPLFHSNPIINFLITKAVILTFVRNYAGGQLVFEEHSQWEALLGEDYQKYLSIKRDGGRVMKLGRVRHVILTTLEESTDDLREHFHIIVFGLSAMGQTAIMSDLDTMVMDVSKSYPSAFSTDTQVLSQYANGMVRRSTPEVDRHSQLENPPLHKDSAISMVLSELISQPVRMNGVFNERIFTTAEIIRACGERDIQVRRFFLKHLTMRVLHEENHGIIRRWVFIESKRFRKKRSIFGMNQEGVRLPAKDEESYVNDESLDGMWPFNLDGSVPEPPREPSSTRKLRA